jgi:peroxiredoxin
MFRLYTVLAISLLLMSQALNGADFGLKKGQVAPDFSAKDLAGKEFSLKQSLKQGPVVLVFYRGGWCPYCNLQLKKLEKEVLKATREAKGSLVAVSVDLPNEGVATKSKQKLSYTIISDPKLAILKPYNVLFKVPEDLVKKYKESYSIDLEASSGEKHHTIAVPAVFVIGKDGRIVYAYADEDYKVRAPEKDIIEALKKLGGKAS